STVEKPSSTAARSWSSCGAFAPRNETTASPRTATSRMRGRRRFGEIDTSRSLGRTPVREPHLARSPARALLGSARLRGEDPIAEDDVGGAGRDRAAGDDAADGVPARRIDPEVELELGAGDARGRERAVGVHFRLADLDPLFGSAFEFVEERLR